MDENLRAVSRRAPEWVGEMRNRAGTHRCSLARSIIDGPLCRADGEIEEESSGEKGDFAPPGSSVGTAPVPAVFAASSLSLLEACSSALSSPKGTRLGLLAGVAAPPSGFALVALSETGRGDPGEIRTERLPWGTIESAASRNTGGEDV